MPAEHLQNLVRALESFNLESEQNKIIESNKDALADLQSEQWGSTSKDYAGRDIKLLDNPNGAYRPLTVEIKKSKGLGLGAVTNRITLFQTGELYKRLFASISGGKYTIKSDVPYFSTLMKRTGDVAGLDAEQREKFFKSFTRPGVQKALKEKVGISF